MKIAYQLRPHLLRRIHVVGTHMPFSLRILYFISFNNTLQSLKTLSENSNVTDKLLVLDS